MSKRQQTMPGDGIPQTLYRLVECLEQRIRAHFRGTGLHWGLRRILQQLWLQDGLSQAELAATVRSSEASVSNMLKHLISGGWVERRRDVYDYRISRVYLTDRGRALRQTVLDELAAADAEIRAALPEADGETLAALLDRARAVLSPEVTAPEESEPSGIYDSPGPPGGL